MIIEGTLTSLNNYKAALDTSKDTDCKGTHLCVGVNVRTPA